jgi:hypothetical protein
MASSAQSGVSSARACAGKPAIASAFHDCQDLVVEARPHPRCARREQRGFRGCERASASASGIPSVVAMAGSSLHPQGSTRGLRNWRAVESVVRRCDCVQLGRQQALHLVALPT